MPRRPQPPTGCAACTACPIVMRQQQERVRLERALKSEKQRNLDVTKQVYALHAELRDIRAYLRDVLTCKAMTKQTLPDILYAVEYYVGGMTESRHDRQLRSQAMIGVSLKIRELLTALYGDELGDEV